MPALDNCLPQITNAIKKENWVIDPEPLFVKIGHRKFFIDIHARQLSNSSQGYVAIFEAKCFSTTQPQQDQLYSSLGQYLMYREGLKPLGWEDFLYLAIPTHAYHGIFKEVAMNVVREIRMKMLVVDLDKEEIVAWLR